MQRALPDWQNIIELHIVTMEKNLGGDYTNRRNNERFETGCQALLSHVNTTYGSLEDFNRFMKANVTEELSRRAGRYDVDAEWDEIPETNDPIEQAEILIDFYENTFKRKLEDVESLPPKSAPFRGPLPSP